MQLSITGKEGFFALVSNKDFSLHEALQYYREKDGVEKLFNSMKKRTPYPTDTLLDTGSDQRIHSYRVPCSASHQHTAVQT